MKSKEERIIVNAGAFKILSKPEDVIGDIADAARTCYKSFKNKSYETDCQLVKNLMSREHYAMLEMADIKVRFSNVSRGFTHEMVRHRLASYAQSSTRYVDERGVKIVVPPYIYNDDSSKYRESIEVARMHADSVGQTYTFLRNEGWKSEDARQFLPIGMANEIVVKANIREWRHIFTMRCDKFAHWEIRELMISLLRSCQSEIPLVFDDFEFFDNDKYARPIQSKAKILDRIKHELHCGAIDIITLRNYIDSVAKGEENEG